MTKDRVSRLRDHIRGCLAGVAIGDALGMSVEILTAEEILKATDGRGVTGFLPPQQVRMGKKFTSLAHLPAGASTDDWQLTEANARSLISCREFSPLDQAHELVAEVRRDICGWGGTTRKSARQIADRLAELDLEDPNVRAGFVHVAPPPKNGRGSGNGVAMRVAPLPLFRYLRDGGFHHEPLASQVMALGLQTHGDPRASFAAAAVAAAVANALYCVEQKLTKPKHVRSLLRIVSIDTARFLEHRYQTFRPGDPRLSERLELAYRLADQPDRLRQEIGTSSFCVESVPFALATALQHLDDFRSALLTAVNAGGDTDTNASLAGAVVGACVGLDGIPKSWLKEVPDSAKAIDLADRLIEAAAVG